MTADQYLQNIIARKSAPSGFFSPASMTKVHLEPIIREWGRNFIRSIDFSGSYAKGTAVQDSTDVDLFISLKSETPHNLKVIFDSLHSFFEQKGYRPRKQNVSIGILDNGIRIDLVPGKKQAGNTNTHSLYRNRTQSWIQTDIDGHIRLIANSGRRQEIKALKIWRNIHGLNFPSFYLEMTVIDALYGKRQYQLSQNFLSILDYLRDGFYASRVLDPASSSNIISDDLSLSEKQMIVDAAEHSRFQQLWGNIIW